MKFQIQPDVTFPWIQYQFLSHEERGFLAVMWPQIVAFLVFLGLWVAFLRWYF